MNFIMTMDDGTTRADNTMTAMNKTFTILKLLTNGNNSFEKFHQVGINTLIN